MDTAKRFFRKYLFSSILILLAFLIVNVVLIFGVLLAAWNSSTDPDISVSQILDGIHTDVEGTVFADDKVTKLLSEKSSWAMLLNDTGNVVWENAMPEDLPRQYTSSDIAKFSRWYLEEYPVIIQTHPSGLLVIGCPPNSIVKYNLITDATYISTTTLGIAFVIVINILLMLLLFWHNTRKVERAVVPILHGIETIAHGSPIFLSEKGELAEINTKLNRAGEHILKKDKARAEWINGISHDVRTPLSIMLGYAGEIEDNNMLPNITQEQAGIIRKQGEKLRRLIADLNLTSKLEYSMQPLNIETIYPTELTRQVISEFLNNGLEDKFTIDFDVASDTDAVILQGDKSLLMRMLGNLIQNSISHNSDGCHILVIIRKVAKSCEFVITDDGIGLSENQMKQFNSGTFYMQGYNENSETEHGFGLRLVHQIVKSHKGNICFETNHSTGLLVKIHLNL